MTVYTPSAFASTDFEQAKQLIDAHPFATLITSIDGAEPQVTHLPLLLADGALWGHVARPNPHWKLFAAAAPHTDVQVPRETRGRAEAAPHRDVQVPRETQGRAEAARTVAVFHGPHTYISPLWYEDPDDNVPTWNYATVHVAGTPQLLDDAASARVLDELTARFEKPGGWRASPAVVAPKLRGIVGFRMPVARLDAKFKMSQNKTGADRRGVLAGLRASSHPDDQAVLRWMEAR